jgi:hypothetical protein
MQIQGRKKRNPSLVRAAGRGDIELLYCRKTGILRDKTHARHENTPQLMSRPRH